MVSCLIPTLVEVKEPFVNRILSVLKLHISLVVINQSLLSINPSGEGLLCLI